MDHSFMISVLLKISILAPLKIKMGMLVNLVENQLHLYGLACIYADMKLSRKEMEGRVMGNVSIGL